MLPVPVVVDRTYVYTSVERAASVIQLIFFVFYVSSAKTPKVAGTNRRPTKPKPKPYTKHARIVWGDGKIESLHKFLH